MIKKLLYTSFFTAVAFSLAACVSIQLTPEGEKARMLSSEKAAKCQKLGKTTVRVRPSILAVPRQQTVITKELQILARNSTASMHGDTVAPISEIDNGQQTFEVYRCVPQ